MDLDITLFLQLGILLGLLSILAPLLHAPLLQVLAAREQQTVGVMAQVRRLIALTRADEATFTQRMAATRQRAHLDREALRQSGRAQAEKIRSEARRKLQAQRHAERQKLDAAYARALGDLAPQRQRWTSQLVSGLLARSRAN